MTSILTQDPKKTFGPRFFTENGQSYSIIATVRYDDQCGNGHNSFSITGEIWTNPKGRDCESCGCIHDQIAKHFPELAPFIKWHLCASDGPMHYIANTVYHASNKDCHGLLKGEFRQFTNKTTGELLWTLDVPAEQRHGATILSNTEPAPVTLRYTPYGRTGDGKERELDSARSSAIWPEATDEELCSPDLKEKLIERLPNLLKEFEAAVTSLGFIF